MSPSGSTLVHVLDTHHCLMSKWSIFANKNPKKNLKEEEEEGEEEEEKRKRKGTFYQFGIGLCNVG